FLEDKRKIGVLKEKIAEQEKALSRQSFQHAVLEQQTEAASAERNTVADKFQQMIYDVQQKSGLKNLLLERKLENIQDSIEVADTQVSEVMTSANGGSPGTAEGVSKKFETIMATKSDSITELQEERSKLQKAHAELVRAFEAKLAEYGVPREEMGFEPRLLA
ncbi:Dynein regulatory complex subunit 4, partial [Perkinsus olseni]